MLLAFAVVNDRWSTQDILIERQLKGKKKKINSKSIVFIYSLEDHSFTVGGNVMAEHPREGHL